METFKKRAKTSLNIPDVRYYFCHMHWPWKPIASISQIFVWLTTGIPRVEEHKVLKRIGIIQISGSFLNIHNVVITQKRMLFYVINWVYHIIRTIIHSICIRINPQISHYSIRNWIMTTARKMFSIFPYFSGDLKNDLILKLDFLKEVSFSILVAPRQYFTFI